MTFGEIESGVAFLAAISFDRALKFVVAFRDQFQREPCATLHANTKCAGLKWFSENAIGRGMVSHRNN